MSKTITFVRHGQSPYNAGNADIDVTMEYSKKSTFTNRRISSSTDSCLATRRRIKDNCISS